MKSNTNSIMKPNNTTADIDYVNTNNEFVKLLNENQTLRERNEQLEKKIELFENLFDIIDEYKKIYNYRNVEKNNLYEADADNFYDDDLSISSHSSMPSLVEIDTNKLNSSDDHSYSSMPSLVSCSSTRLAMTTELCGNN